jgi:NH3-dependent NAD+ synthetase
LKIINLRDKELWKVKMDKNTKVDGRTMRSMEMANILGQMVIPTEESTEMVKGMVLGS